MEPWLWILPIAVAIGGPFLAWKAWVRGRRLRAVGWAAAVVWTVLIGTQVLIGIYGYREYLPGAVYWFNYHLWICLLGLGMIAVPWVISVAAGRVLPPPAGTPEMVIDHPASAGAVAAVALATTPMPDEPSPALGSPPAPPQPSGDPNDWDRLVGYLQAQRDSFDVSALNRVLREAGWDDGLVIEAWNSFLPPGQDLGIGPPIPF